MDERHRRGALHPVRVRQSLLPQCLRSAIGVCLEMFFFIMFGLVDAVQIILSSSLSSRRLIAASVPGLGLGRDAQSRVGCGKDEYRSYCKVRITGVADSDQTSWWTLRERSDRWSLVP